MRRRQARAIDPLRKDPFSFDNGSHLTRLSFEPPERTYFAVRNASAIALFSSFGRMFFAIISAREM